MARRELRGQGASGGVAIGPVFVYRKAAANDSRPSAAHEIAPEDVPREIDRLRSALDIARDQLAGLVRKTREQTGPEGAAVFQAQLLMVDDPEIAGKAEEVIQAERLDAERALAAAGQAARAVLATLDDEYLRVRADDVGDVVSRVAAILRGETLHPLAGMKEPAVVVAEELLPSDTVQVDRDHVLGFITERGSSTSHAAILARTLGIPAVMGVTDITTAVRTGETVVADGDTGLVLASPDKAEVETWRGRREAWEKRRAELLARVYLPAVTTDGHRVEVAANIGSPGDVEAALRFGAEGVGLFRTEFLFMDRETPPGEDEMFDAYSKVARRLAGRPVIIRTIDVGGDKPIAWLGETGEANPFLGRRGVRLALAREEVFLTQLRALVRARAHGDVWVMVPMVSDLEEVRAVRRLLKRAVEEVGDRVGSAAVAKNTAEAAGSGADAGAASGTVAVGVTGRAPEPPLGIRVEVPSAALMADRLMDEVDFVSVGTNDLTQYTLAVDRTNEKVAALADPLHPAVLRLIAQVAEAGREHGRWVGVCGDLAGDPLAARILVGLGANEFSMAPPLIPEVREAVRMASLREARRMAQRALDCATAGEVRELLGR